MTGEQLRIVRRSLGEVGYGRELRRRTDERQRHDADVADAGVGREDLDVGDAGNHAWGTYGDEQPIRARLAVEIDVGAADVRGRDLGQHEHRNQRKEAPTARPRHRLIARIARPACRPIHVIRHVMSMAMIIPRRKSALFASRAKN